MLICSTDHLLKLASLFEKLAVSDNLVIFRPKLGTELLYFAELMKKEGIPTPEVLFQVGKLIQEGNGVPENTGFEVIKILSEQHKKGFYEGHRNLSYNKDVGQGHPHSLNRLDWHQLDILIRKLTDDLIRD